MKAAKPNYRGETPQEAQARRQQEEQEHPGHAAVRRAIQTANKLHTDTAEYVRDNVSNGTGTIQEANSMEAALCQEDDDNSDQAPMA